MLRILNCGSLPAGRGTAAEQDAQRLLGPALLAATHGATHDERRRAAVESSSSAELSLCTEGLV